MTITLTPQDRAVIEAAIETSSRARLHAFGKYVRPYLVMGDFYLYLCDHLEAVLRGDIRRLAIFAPPQHGKSTLASEIFPAFWLAKHPDTPMILASYNDNIATEKAGFVRDIVEGSEYKSLFPNVKLRPDNRAKSTWLVEGHRGGMRSAGTNGSITGRSGGFVVIDDPIKGWEDAQSPVIRETTWRWYDSMLRTRLWENAPLLLIQTRWHEDDLAGRILNSPEAPDWTVLRLPALSESQEERDDNNRRLNLPLGLPDPLGRNEPDMALAPYRYSSEYLIGLRNTMTSYTWMSEYMGSPRPLEGNMIKRAMIQLVDVVPHPVIKRVRYWDIAATQGGGAQTAGVLVAKVGFQYYIEDVVFGQWGIEERNAVILQTAVLDAMRGVVPDDGEPDRDPTTLKGWNSVKIHIEQEPGSSGKDAFESFRRLLEGFPVFADRPTGAKPVRFNVVASTAASGNLFVVKGNWNTAYLDEIVAFPNGTHVDMADATSGAISQLSKGGFQFGIANRRPDAEDLP